MGYEVTAALRAWREAEREMARATEGDLSVLAKQVVDRRAEYHQLVADQVAAVEAVANQDRTWVDGRDRAMGTG